MSSVRLSPANFSQKQRATSKAATFSRTTLAAETASTTSSSVDNTAASTGGYVVHQHVTAKSGTTPTLVTTIEHSTDNVTFATLVELASVNAVGSTRVVGTGTVNRYRRRKSTIAGTNPSFTHAVTLATW